MKQKISIQLFAILGLTLFFLIFAPPPALAVDPLENPAEGQLIDDVDFEGLLVRIIEWALYAAGGVAVLFLIYGGFQYITSRGNEEQTEAAKKTITAAIIGIVIIIMAFAIVLIVNNVLTEDAPA